MGGCRCSFQDCENSSSNSPNTHFFHFPVKDPDRVIKWIKMSNNMSFVDIPVSKLKNKVICDLHFNLKDFMNNKKERLIKLAFPTIHYKNGIQTDLLTEPFEWTKKNETVNIPRNFLKFNNPENSITLDDIPPKVVPSKSPVATKTLLKSPKIITLPVQKQPAPIPKADVKVEPENLVLEVAEDGTLIESQITEEKFKLQTVPQKFIVQQAGRGQIHQLVIAKPKTGMILNKFSVQPAKKIKLDQKIQSPQKISQIETPVEVPKILEEWKEAEPEEIPSPVRKVPETPQPNPGLDPELLARAYKTIEDYKKNFEELKEMISKKSDPKPLEKPEYPKIESLNMTKVQLFNGIKKYLNPSMVALLRIEMFGAQEREWKPDEKSLSIELFKLGDNIYRYFRDEMRFRLPPSQVVEQWLQEDENMVDLEDAC